MPQVTLTLQGNSDPPSRTPNVPGHFDPLPLLPEDTEIPYFDLTSGISQSLRQLGGLQAFVPPGHPNSHPHTDLR